MRNRDVVVVTLVPFALTLALYLFTLAPSVTFEDSGELAAAAYNLGVPHPPGYPVFCMVGKLFTLLPFGNVAWRLNFMSAFFTALSSAVLAWAVLLLLRRLARSGAGEGRDRPRPPYVLAAAIAAGIMAGIAFEAWEQALITEVYGLNSFVLTLDLLLLISWELAPSLQRQRFFYALCFTLGLGLVVHPISVVFLPLALVYIALVDVRYLFKAKRLLAGALYFALGISPVLYLPVVSRTEPIMDWGDPETFRNFFLVVTRGLIPYETHELSKTMGQLGYYFHLLVRQWFPVLLVPALLGFLALLRRSRRHFWIAVAFLLLTAPLVTVTTNINVTTGQPEVIDGNKWIASVFYIPSYICLSLTAGVGFWYIGAGLTRLLRNAGAAALAIILPPASRSCLFHIWARRYEPLLLRSRLCLQCLPRCGEGCAGDRSIRS